MIITSLPRIPTRRIKLRTVRPINCCGRFGYDPILQKRGFHWTKPPQCMKRRPHGSNGSMAKCWCIPSGHPSFHPLPFPSLRHLNVTTTTTMTRKNACLQQYTCGVWPPPAARRRNVQGTTTTTTAVPWDFLFIANDVPPKVLCFCLI